MRNQINIYSIGWNNEEFHILRCHGHGSPNKAFDFLYQWFARYLIKKQNWELSKDFTHRCITSMDVLSIPYLHYCMLNTIFLFLNGCLLYFNTRNVIDYHNLRSVIKTWIYRLCIYICVFFIFFINQWKWRSQLI